MAAGDWKDLLKAAQSGDLNLVKYHIGNGVDPNYQHPEFLTTPLIESIEQQHLKVMTYLLENGADPRLNAGFSSDSPLSVARKVGNPVAVHLLRPYYPSFLSRFYKVLVRIAFKR
jgi:ankyrin repeat protein